MIGRIDAFALVCLALIPFFSLRAQDNGQEKEIDPFSDEAQAEVETLLAADEVRPAEEGTYLAPGEVERITKAVQPSVVTVRQLSRDGDRRGTGSGFVVADTGLIATNLHVIGEGRPIEVELHDGSILPVVEVTASDRRYDLAIVRVEPGDTVLRALPLAPRDEVEQGQIIIGFGAPEGLEFSVVPGVVSAIRKLDPGFLGARDETPDFPLVQIAMPIERGNSGGPIVNLSGQVAGVVTLKHRRTENLGFAVPAGDLQDLLDQPNPIPMARWKTIGLLDPKQWTAVMGASWSQRGGVIKAELPGDGFGGRSLCLSESEVPATPYEIAVRVRLDDESGAAGLVFASDGGDAHYGFYPSGGRIRLTRFEGPDVYSWTILEQIAAPAYQPGEWNRIRVRVEEDKVTGFVNGTKILEVRDDVLRGGRVGLCKFRDTVAEFRRFEVGQDLSPESVPAELREKLAQTIEEFTGGRKDAAQTLQRLAIDAKASGHLLEGKAEELEALAAEVRRLGESLHLRVVEGEIGRTLNGTEAEIDLFEVGIQIARVDDPLLDVEHYRSLFGRLVSEAGLYLEETVGDEPVTEVGEKVEALRDFFFRENGFHGSRGEYYHHANSYLNHVIDDREGIPITLSVIFIEMARRLGLEGVFGASVPGHFLIGFRDDAESLVPAAFYDAFDGGREISPSQFFDPGLEEGEPPSYFEPASARDIAVRMLRNLILIEIEQRSNPAGAEKYLDLLLSIEPDSAQERFQRALVRLQEKDRAGARADIDWLLEHRPPGIDYRRLEQFRGTLEAE